MLEAISVTLIIAVTEMASSMVRSPNMFSYQRRENPVKLVWDFLR